jgi:hypothetical protein
MKTLNAFIPLYTFIYTDTHSLLIQANMNNNNMHVNFPLTTQIIILDSSDRETKEKENEHVEKLGGKAGEAEEREEAEKQQQTKQKDEEEEAIAAEPCVLPRPCTLITAPSWVVEPTPQRGMRLDSNQSFTAQLQPARSIDESKSIETLEVCMVEELPNITDDDIRIMMSDTPL